MIIERIFTKEFCSFSEREITLSPGFNFIFGENEAGKTTLLNFLRFFFFYTNKRSIKKDSPLNYIKADLDRFSGQIQVKLPDRTALIERKGKKVTGDNLPVFDMDERTFFRIYTLTLQGTETLKKNPGHPFYSLLSGSKSLDISSSVQTLTEKMNSIYTERSARKPLNSAIENKRELNSRIRIVKKEMEKLPELNSRLSELFAEKEKLSDLHSGSIRSAGNEARRKELLEQKKSLENEAVNNWKLSPERVAILREKAKDFPSQPLVREAGRLKQKITRLAAELEHSDSQILKQQLDSSTLSEQLLFNSMELSRVQRLETMLFVSLTIMVIASIAMLDGPTLLSSISIIVAAAFMGLRYFQVKKKFLVPESTELNNSLANAQESLEHLIIKKDELQKNFYSLLDNNNLPQKLDLVIQSLEEEEKLELICSNALDQIRKMEVEFSELAPGINLIPFSPPASEEYFFHLSDLEERVRLQTDKISRLAHINNELSTLSKKKQITDPKELSQQISSISAQIAEVQIEIEKINNLDLESLEQEFSAVSEEINDLAKEWAVSRIAVFMAENGRNRLESEKQPGLLSKAGSFFSRITDGKYTAITRTEEEFRLRHESGEETPLDHLSTGTMAQLYFCLSAAYFQSLTSLDEADCFPLIIDETWSVFDKKRARTAMEILMEISSHRQILFMSCHDYLLNMYEGLGGKCVIRL